MKKNKCIIIFVFILTILLFSTVLNYDNSSAFDTIAVFLSITIGFTITALSIIANSLFSKELYNTEDKTDNSRTLLHTLMFFFRNSMYIFTATISLILFYKFLQFPIVYKSFFCIKNYQISIEVLLKAMIWTMSIVSLHVFIKLFNMFVKFVIQSAKQK